MIVVTTPTGQIGRQVVARLLDAGAPVRVVVRDASRLPAEVRERVEVVEGSHGDRAVVDKAFTGAEAVFWLVPPDPRAADVGTAFVDFSRPASRAVAEHGVRRVVGVSALGRGTPVAGEAGHVTATLAVDDLFAASGVAYRALALPTFMDNLLWQAELIGARGMFTSTVAGDRAAPMCATRDIAEVAARLLLDGSWDGVGDVPVLGPEDLSQEDVARIMSEVLERPVRYQRVPAEDFRAHLVASGSSEGVSRAMIEMFDAKDAGLDLGVTRTPENGSPTTFRQWCEEVLKPAVLG